MDFHQDAIDLVKTFGKFKERYGGARGIRNTFALSVVCMAAVRLGGLSTEGYALPGIRRCLLQLTFLLRWRDRLWIVPLPFAQRLFHQGLWAGTQIKSRTKRF